MNRLICLFIFPEHLETWRVCVCMRVHVCVCVCCKWKISPANYVSFSKHQVILELNSWTILIYDQPWNPIRCLPCIWYCIYSCRLTDTYIQPYAEPSIEVEKVTDKWRKCVCKQYFCVWSVKSKSQASLKQDIALFNTWIFFFQWYGNISQTS